MKNFDRSRHADISRFIQLNASFLVVSWDHGIEFIRRYPLRCGVIYLRCDD